MTTLLTTRLLRLAAFLVMTLLSANRAAAQVPGWVWTVGPQTNNSVTCATVDAAGNLYLTGAFWGTVTFGSTTLTSAGSNADVYVAKRSSDGVYQWAAQVGGGDPYDDGQSLTVDASGNVVVTGSFRQTATFGTTSLTTQDPIFNVDAFVAKLSPGGAWLWAVQAGGPSYAGTSGAAVVADAAGDLYVTGRYGTQSHTTTFGALTLTSPANFGTFVAKLSSAGVWQWVTGGGGDGYIGGLALDGAGNLYVSGLFTSSSATFGSTTLATIGTIWQHDAYVAKLNSAGVWQWAVSGGGTNEDGANALVTDAAGDVYVAGNFHSATATFGTTTLTNPIPPGSFDDPGTAYVAKLNPAGVWQWAVQAGGSLPEFGNCLARDGRGDLYVAGRFSGTATFGATVLTQATPTLPTDSCDVFIAKLTPSGTWQWAVPAGGTGYDAAQTLAVTSSGIVYASGTSDSPTAAFGPFSIGNTTGVRNYFTARLGVDMPTGSPENDAVSFLTLAPNPAHHTIRLTGAASPTATLIDALGRAVRVWPVSTAAPEISLTGISPGVYTVRAGAATRRLVVE